MRRVNAVVSMAIIGLFLVHGIAGAFQLTGMMSGGNKLIEALAWIMMILVAVHMVIGILLTIKTVQISRKAGVSYIRENALFWIRRVSGFALMVLVFLHFILFVQTGDGIFRLADFGMAQLIGQLIMLLALALHLLCNIRPVAVALGLYKGNGYGRDILLILSIVLAFCAVAFGVYYLRWNVWWR